MKQLLQITLLLLALNHIVFSQNILEKDFPILNKIYQADGKRADYVIVIDQSGSMRNYWTNVRNGINGLIGSLPNEDYVSILGFSSECQALVVPRRLNQSSKNELIAQINRLPYPNGQRTDLFEAIDKTLDELNRPNSNELKFLFFITDFINDPPSNTRWNSTNIHLLKEKYERIIQQTNRLLKLYALQLPLDINAGRDYNQFSNIFHTISAPIFLNQGTLLEWFDRLRAEIEREKLRMLVENDMKDAFKIVSVENSINLIEKNSHFKIAVINQSLLPLNIDSIVLNSDEYGKIQSSGLLPEALPNEVLTLQIPLNKEMLLKEGTLCQKYPVTIKSFEIYTSSKEVTEFGKLNLNPEKVYLVEKPQSLSFLIGFNCWQILIAGVIILFLLYYLFYPCLKPVWLFNKKNVKISMDLNDKIVELNERELITNRKSISFDNNIIVEDPLTQTGLRNLFIFKANFVVKKPKCLIRRPKAGTYVSIELPENVNYSFTLIENALGKGKEYVLGKELTSEPIDISKGIRLEAYKQEVGQSYKLRITINPIN